MVSIVFVGPHSVNEHHMTYDDLSTRNRNASN
jgi:hypothetical protein